MKAQCLCLMCSVRGAFRHDHEDVFHPIGNAETLLEDMHRCAAQRKEKLTRKLRCLRRLVESLQQQNSRRVKGLHVAQAEVESLKRDIATMERESDKYRQAKEAAEANLRHYQVALEKAITDLQQQQKENAALEAKLKARAKAEENRVNLLWLEVERATKELEEEKKKADAAVEECKKIAQQLRHQGLLTKELEEELACITGLPVQQLGNTEGNLLQMEMEITTEELEKKKTEDVVEVCKKIAQQLRPQGLLTRELEEELACITDPSMELLGTREVDSSSEMDASDEADPGSLRLEELLAADEHEPPEPSLEECLSAIAEMKIPRALSPLPPSPPLTGRPPTSVASLAPVQFAPPTAPLQPALPAGEPPPPVPKQPQLTWPPRPVQSIPVLDPLLSEQGPKDESCEAWQSAREQDPSMQELPKPRKRWLAHSHTQDEQLSDREVQLPTKKPLLTKRDLHRLFSSSSSEEEGEVTEEKSAEQSPLGAVPPFSSERVAAMGGAESAMSAQAEEAARGALSCGSVHAGMTGTPSGYLSNKAVLGTHGGVVCSPVDCNLAPATASKAAPGDLSSQGTLGMRGGVACSPANALLSRELPGNATRAREGHNAEVVCSPATATASKATSGNLSGGGQSLGLYRTFLRSQAHVIMSQQAFSKGVTPIAVEAVLRKLAFFAKQPEVQPEELEQDIRKVKGGSLVQGALCYLYQCKANPVSAYCRGEQAPPLITKFETLLLQALAQKQDGWVMLLSALQARYWSRSQPKMLMGRASYLRLIGVLCCKLDEPTVAQTVIWDLLGTNQAPFLVASVVGAWPGLLKALPPGIVQKTVAYLLLDSPEHTLNSTLEFQARQVLRMLGPLHGFAKYIPKQLAEELLAPLLSPHKCGDTCVMHHRSLQELCQRSPKSLLPWLLEQRLAPLAQSLLSNESSGCLILLLVSLWKMYTEPPKALEPLITKLVRRVKSSGLRSKKFFLKWEGTREILMKKTSDNQGASTTEPIPQGDV
ncbi:uncharacterized protein LOC144099149 isoform X2 [Amblyomma americanum]